MTKHVSFAPYSYQILHDEDTVNIEIDFKKTDEFDLVFENESLLIDRNSITKSLNFLKLTDNAALQIPKKPWLNAKTILSEEDVRLISTKPFSSSSLIYPFFSKLTYPDSFKVKNYQVEGIKWLQEENGRLLADDMGLGKTMQTILAVKEAIMLGQVKNILIICPRSLMHNWQSEIKLWAPSLTSILITNIKNNSEVWHKVYGKSHFYITNYDHIRKLPTCLLQSPPDIVIADEAHKLRKSSSQVNKSISKIKPKRFWALSGTPIEKDTDDLATIMQLIKPNFSSSLKKLSASSIRSLSKQHILRRVKKDVLKSLKKKNSQTYYISLNKKQNTAYKATREKMVNSNESLKYFGELMDICSGFEGESSKLDFIEDLIDKISYSKEKVVIFSYTISPLHALKLRLDKTYGQDFSVIYEGSMDSIQRKNNIKKFKEDDDVGVILCSGKIAGEGLNLTEANNVIFINEWWNPSSNRQAEDRVLRIGQSKEVNIYRIRCKNTVEERLDEIIEGKVKLTNKVVESLVDLRKG
ncbi:MAG: DEAD/DEAH box helicase [Pseudomonadota bacterium]|nr:DEAD/DEAH box helicase [Pseudomonadota bacterium]